MEGSYTKVTFKVHADTEFGQTLRLSGSTRALGADEISESVELYTTPEQYPMWTTLEPLIIPRGQTSTYRYCIYEGAAFRGWETIAVGGRQLSTQGVAMTVGCSFFSIKVAK